MSTETDLLGDPLPEPLPHGERFMDWRQLAGHTIKAAFDEPDGRRECDLVIVTETDCWIVAKAETEGCGEDGAYLRVKYGGGEVLSDFVSPAELFEEQCISRAVFDVLQRAEEDRKAKENAARAARLRAEAERLAPTTPT